MPRPLEPKRGEEACGVLTPPKRDLHWSPSLCCWCWIRVLIVLIDAVLIDAVLDTVVVLVAPVPTAPFVTIVRIALLLSS